MITTNLNLKVNGVVVNNGTLLYEIENLVGDKLYFFHRGIQYCKLKSTKDMEFINNKSILRELFYIHNKITIPIFDDTAPLEFEGFDVDGLFLLVRGCDKSFMEWVNGGNIKWTETL